MKILPFARQRQFSSSDCGADLLLMALASYGIEEREDRISILAGTRRSGTSCAGMVRVLRYFGLPIRAREGMTVAELRRGIDRGWPTLCTLQAYRSSSRPYRELWSEGHWAGAIGHHGPWMLFADPSAFHTTWQADEELSERWHDIDGGRRIRHWGCMILRRPQFNPRRLLHMD